VVILARRPISASVDPLVVGIDVVRRDHRSFDTSELRGRRSPPVEGAEAEPPDPFDDTHVTNDTPELGGAGEFGLTQQREEPS
jgi:hypothetical protein